MQWLSGLFADWYNLVFAVPFLFVAVFLALQLAGISLGALFGGAGHADGDGHGGLDADGHGAGVDADAHGVGVDAHGIDADAGVEVHADVGVDVHADAGVDIDADAGIDVDADAGIDVDADAGVDVDADAGVDAHTDVDADAGADADGHADLDGHAHAHAHGDAVGTASLFVLTLSFFNIGKVPLSLVVEGLLLLFGVFGLLINEQLVALGAGYPAYFLPAAILGAGVGSVLIIKSFSELMARYFPMSESYVSGNRALIGLAAVTVSQTLTEEHGRVKLRDRFGNDLNLHCRLKPGIGPVGRGERVVLISYDKAAKLFVVRPEPGAAVKS